MVGKLLLSSADSVAGLLLAPVYFLHKEGKEKGYEMQNIEVLG